jgi:hypothetical protein
MLGMIPLFTSFPPNLKNRGTDGTDRNLRYFETCFQTWLMSGFAPFSVNLADENFEPAASLSHLNLIVSEGAPPSFSPKRVPTLDDLLTSANATGYVGPFAIVNADIMLKLDEHDAKRIRDLEPDQFIVSRRIDIKNIESHEGELYRPGVDFIVMHTKNIKALLGSPFYFGLPWWDHFVPIQLYKLGLRPVHLSKSVAYHLEHDDRWDEAAWIYLGELFISFISQKSISPFAEAYEARKNDALRPYAASLRGAGRYLRDMMKPKNVALREKLLRLSALNESILNEITGNIST